MWRLALGGLTCFEIPQSFAKPSQFGNTVFSGPLPNVLSCRCRERLRGGSSLCLALHSFTSLIKVSQMLFVWSSHSTT